MTTPLHHRIDWQINRFLFTPLIIVAAVAFLPQAALAQQVTPGNVVSEESEELPEIQTFQLRHADAGIVFNVLQTLLAGEAGVQLAIGEDDRIIVRGAPPIQAKVRETLKVLDQPPEDRSVVKVFSLMYSDASLAAQLVEQMVGDVNVAFDARTNSLVVSASSEIALEKVEVLAQILDQGADGGRSGITYKVELFWLIESGNDGEGDSASTRPVDPRITSAVNELQRHGFVGAKQVGHVSVIVKPGGQFRVHSSESLGQLQMHGELNESGNQQLELKLDLAIIDGDEEIASVMTEFNTRPEHEVVIGIASASNPDRRSAFVIRVEK